MDVARNAVIRIRPAVRAERAASSESLAPVFLEMARRMECAHDARAAYARAYAERLTRLAGRLSAEDARCREWLQSIVVEHAHRYLRALESWDSGDAALTPAPWRAVFALARRRAPKTIRPLCERVHLSFDLPLAVARVALPEGDRTMWRKRYLGATRGLSHRRYFVRAWDGAMLLIEATDGDSLKGGYATIEEDVMRALAASVR